MSRSCSTEGKQDKVTWIMAALHRNNTNCADHIVINDRQDSARRFSAAESERTRYLLLYGPLCLSFV
jgi:hypothetical protein